MIQRNILLGLWLSGLTAVATAGELKWTTDLPAAQKKAEADQKMVLMNFTGSDWCGWCKKLKADVFNKEDFVEYAAKNLVLVELDFPSSKVKQSAELKKANAELKKQHGIRGYPTILVLNSKGKEVWKQVGYLKGGPTAFIAKLEEARQK